MTVFTLVLVYQSYVTRGIAMTTVSYFNTLEQCVIAANKLSGYDKLDCIAVTK